MPNWDHEDLKGRRGMSGDPVCKHCGVSWCQSLIVGGPACPRYVPTDGMSLRDKNIKREPNKEFMAYDAGENATKAELESYLTAYLKDDFFAQQFADCIDMIRRKNADYSQGEQKGDRIAAFRRIARDINITMEQAWAVFCQKHWGAVMKYVKEGTVESEAIEGRIHDVINYMVLLAAIINDRNGKDE